MPEELQRREARLAAIAAGQDADRRACGGSARAGAGGPRAENGGARGADAADRPEAAGYPPAPPPATPAPRPKDQVNLTDPDSRIMPAGKRFVQAYNAQAAVDVASLLIVAQHVSQHANDLQEMVPASRSSPRSRRPWPTRRAARR